MDSPRSNSLFPDTRWSIVLAAQGGSTVARRALTELCEAYWYPLYACARRRGLSPEDAQDRTQEFFHTLIAGDALQQVSQERGKLRAYFLASMKNVIAQEHRREMREKRGGGAPLVSFDHALSERRLAGEPSDGRSPDVLFDQSWAYAVLDGATRRLEADYLRLGRMALFAEIRGFLASHRGEASYAQAAEKLGMTETALRQAIHQMRKRYRAMLEAEVADTVASPEEVQEELRHLQAVLAGAI